MSTDVEQMEEPAAPVEVKPEPKQFLQQEPVAVGTAEITVPDYQPVAVGTRVIKRPPSLTLQMVNTRASHFYFKRVLQLMRSLGKYR